MLTRLRRAPPAHGSMSRSAATRRSLGVFDEAGVPTHEDTPSFAHGLVDVVDLEGDDSGDGGDHGVRGPKDDRSRR